MSGFRELWKVRKELTVEFKRLVRKVQFRKKWRAHNAHNGTIALNEFPEEKVSVGKYTYGGLHVIAFDNPKEHLTIGSYCSIAEDVTFLLGGEHDYRRLTTFPVWSHVLKKAPFEPSPMAGPIEIGDDVWIGYGAVILSGTRIGRGAVIGANSVVKGYVPPYAVYIADHVAKYRFPEEVIRKLEKADLDEIGKLDEETAERICRTRIDASNVDQVIGGIMNKGEE